MTKHKYYNRYGDEYTFSLDEYGNVLWEGDFKWCRFSWPNVYEPAYEKYLEDVKQLQEPDMDLLVEDMSNNQLRELTFEEFKDAMHKYDEKKQSFIPLSKKYSSLVHSDTSKISMVDPSGGPYIATGMPMRYIPGFDDSAKVAGFEVIETGYRILIEK